MTIGHGMMVKSPDSESSGEPVELVALDHGSANEMDAYERVLGDAMAGDPTLFAREDYVEEAWRIVDPVLQAGTPVYEYEPGSWGLTQVDERIVPADGCHNPVMRAPATAGTEVHGGVGGRVRPSHAAGGAQRHAFPARARLADQRYLAVPLRAPDLVVSARGTL